MSGEGGLKHVVHRRVHLERHQPSSRKKLGYLEKHKDYVKRAKDFHQKERQVKSLYRKAFFRNKEEFAYGMHSTKIENGKVFEKPKHLSTDELRLVDSQDARYIRMREQMDLRVAAKKAEKLHFLDASKPNKHTLFVDNDEIAQNVAASSSGRSSIRAPKRKTLDNFDVAEHLDTVPEMLGCQANRLRKKQLETAKLSDPSKMQKDTQESYKVLFHYQERAKKLRKVREELELRTHLRGKGKKSKVKGGSQHGSAIYKWAPVRKR